MIKINELMIKLLPDRFKTIMLHNNEIQFRDLYKVLRYQNNGGYIYNSINRPMDISILKLYSKINFMELTFFYNYLYKVKVYLVE